MLISVFFKIKRCVSKREGNAIKRQEFIFFEVKLNQINSIQKIL